MLAWWKAVTLQSGVRGPGGKDYITDIEADTKSYTRKSWSGYLIEQDISFAWGSRSHGNMMAFSNGIPAVWIMHDARTKELIETMKLPYITKEKLMEIKCVEEFFDICRYDDDFKESYRNLSLQYIYFLNENHVQHTFDVS